MGGKLIDILVGMVNLYLKGVWHGAFSDIGSFICLILKINQREMDIESFIHEKTPNFTPFKANNGFYVLGKNK